MLYYYHFSRPACSVRVRDKMTTRAVAPGRHQLTIIVHFRNAFFSRRTGGPANRLLQVLRAWRSLRARTRLAARWVSPCLRILPSFPLHASDRSPCNAAVVLLFFSTSPHLIIINASFLIRLRFRLLTDHIPSMISYRTQRSFLMRNRVNISTASRPSASCSSCISSQSRFTPSGSCSRTRGPSPSRARAKRRK